jgi:hypothetical protein
MSNNKAWYSGRKGSVLRTFMTYNGSPGVLILSGLVSMIAGKTSGSFRKFWLYFQGDY